MHRPLLLALLLAGPACFVLAQQQAPEPYKAKVATASDEGKAALKRIRVPKPLQLDLFAAEPHLANPVAFSIDDRGRFFVAETYRLHQGVTDIRGIMSWLDDDLACRTVADRVAMMKKRLGKKFGDYSVHHDRVKLVEDTTGAGVADRSSVFADGFNRTEDGIAAGVLARGPDVWFTCIPDLWLLRDPKGKGQATERQKLSTGYGIHVGYLGHDLHGLIMGPDGKIYFSLGDRGLNVKTAEKHLFYPDMGAVLRCNPDGSELEVVASGLRNPQELAFDDLGNLFTGDNNSDGGDRARWVQILEGGDCGWRIGYQFETALGNRGPWNAEKMWHPYHEGQPAWVLPPIINMADGPSGLAYYPGLGLPERYAGHFFLCDFRGGPVNSGVRSFGLKPKGAGYEVTDQHEFVWGVLATDCDFGPDGAFYISDWVNGWGLTGKGRLYKVTHPEGQDVAALKEVKALLAEGLGKKEPAELAKLLAHKHRRVRQEAQFALSAQGKAGLPALTDVATTGADRLARLHAIWGLGQVSVKEPAALEPVRALTADKDAEVRGQAARVLGDRRAVGSLARVLPLLADPEPRVRMLAALAAARLGQAEAVPAAVALLKANADKDPNERHAGVMVLTNCATDKALGDLTGEASVAMRRAAVVALRKKGSAEVARFLDDTDAGVVLEAARAVSDVPITEALGKLAALANRPSLPELLAYRILNAAYLRGTPADADLVARLAARADQSEGVRLEAVKMLGLWDRPAGRDRVTGVWQTRGPRPREVAAASLRGSLGGVFAGPDKVRQEAAKVAGQLGIKEVGPALITLAAETARPAEVRVEALRALAALKDAGLDKAVSVALEDPQPRLRNEGRRLLAVSQPEAALASLSAALDRGGVAEQQGVFDVLGGLKGEGAAKLLDAWLLKLLDGKVPAEARLDLLEAAARHGTPALKAKLAKVEAGRARGDHLAKWRETLAGGDPEAGRRLFLYKAETYCLRCHKVEGQGGEVGPDLTGIGGKQKPEYLLEGIVDPSRQIAKGYELVQLTLTSGQQVSGIVRAEDGKELRLMTPEGKVVVVAKGDIEERQVGKSAMPEDLVKHLSPREVRDLVAFLTSLKEGPKK